MTRKAPRSSSRPRVTRKKRLEQGRKDENKEREGEKKKSRKEAIEFIEQIKIERTEKRRLSQMNAEGDMETRKWIQRKETRTDNKEWRLILVTWNVGGMVRTEQWEIFREWLERTGPDVVLVQETWALQNREVRGYKLFQVPATEKGKRGLAVWVKERDDIVWVQENESAAGDWEITIVGKLHTTDGEEHYVRIVNVYSPQPGDETESQEQYKRLKQILIAKLTKAKSITNIMMGDFNVVDNKWKTQWREGQQQGKKGTDSKNLEMFEDILEAYGMVRLKCFDKDGQPYTNYHTKGTARACPDVVAIPTSTEALAIGRIEHSPALKSGHAHERVTVEFYMPLMVEKRKTRSDNFATRSTTPIVEKQEWEKYRKSLKQKLREGNTNRWRESFKKIDEADKTEVKKITEEIAKLREDIYEQVNNAMDEIRARKKKRDQQWKIGAWNDETKHGKREHLWEKIVKKGGREHAQEEWEEYHENIRKHESEGRERLQKVMNKISMTIAQIAKKSPATVWRMIKEMEGKSTRRIHPPTAIWVKNKKGERMIQTNEREVKNAWMNAYNRDPVATNGQIWSVKNKERVERYVKQYEDGIGIGITTADPTDDPLKRKEFDEVRRKTKKVAAGPSLVGGEMQKEGGKEMQDVMFELVRRCHDLAIVTEGQRTDYVTPAFKHGNPSEEGNFRPVSLMDDDTKYIQGANLNRMRKWDENTPAVGNSGKNGVHPSSFGAKRGRDTQLVLLAVKETARSRKYRKEKGTGETAILMVDVKNAFPSMWREGLARTFIKRGMPDTMYKRWRATNKVLKGRVKIGHMLTGEKIHAQGSNQGASLAADEWVWSLQPIADELQKVGKGTLVAVQPEGMEEVWYPVYLYVDDGTLMPELKNNGEKIEEEPLRCMEKHAKENRYNWAPKKTNLIVMGRDEAETGKTTATFAGVRVTDTESAVLLGETLHTSIYGHSGQFEKIQKRIAEPSRTIPWACAGPNVTAIPFLKILIEARITSRVRVGLALKTTKRTQTDKLNSVNAKVVKQCMDLPTQVSGRALLAEVGKRDTESELELEGLRIYARARRETAGDQLRRVWMVRREDIQKGEKQGFFPRMNALLRAIGLEEVEQDGAMDKMYTAKKWKNTITREIAKREKLRWEKWVKKHGPRSNNLQLHKRTVQTEQYLMWGSKEEIGLKVCLRLGALMLRGNKMEVLFEQHWCELCGERTSIENEEHIVLECTGLKEARDKMFSTVDKQKSGSKWRTNGPETAMVTIMAGGKGNTRSDRVIDRALKTFLVETKKQFKQKLGRNIMESRPFKKSEVEEEKEQQEAVQQAQMDIVDMEEGK
jgi:exonuclease III